MLKEGVILGERYEIISRIGSGGMADVYKAKDHKLNRHTGREQKHLASRLMHG